MIARKLTLKPNNKITYCPKCGNNTQFTLRADRCAEDYCQTWVECKCGYDPTVYQTMYRYENVWGETDNDTAAVALDCWNDAIAAQQPGDTAGQAAEAAERTE